VDLTLLNGPNLVLSILSTPNYGDDSDPSNPDGFQAKIEDLFHNSIHDFVGGDMSNVGWSPNDPAFFLHHCNVDRFWAIWQDCYDYDQINTLTATASNNLLWYTPGRNSGLTQNMPYNYPSDGSPETSFFLPGTQNFPTPRDVMNTNSGPLDYTYDPIDPLVQTGLLSFCNFHTFQSPQPAQPTVQPIDQPTVQLTELPTELPPVVQPTGHPTGQPTGQPVRQPAKQPARQPGKQPTRPARHPAPRPTQPNHQQNQWGEHPTTNSGKFHRGQGRSLEAISGSKFHSTQTQQQAWKKIASHASQGKINGTKWHWGHPDGSHVGRNESKMHSDEIQKIVFEEHAQLSQAPLQIQFLVAAIAECYTHNKSIVVSDSFISKNHLEHKRDRFTPVCPPPSCCTTAGLLDGNILCPGGGLGMPVCNTSSCTWNFDCTKVKTVDFTTIMSTPIGVSKAIVAPVVTNAALASDSSNFFGVSSSGSNPVVLYAVFALGVVAALLVITILVLIVMLVRKNQYQLLNEKP